MNKVNSLFLFFFTKVNEIYCIEKKPMEHHDLHISSFDWCDRIATSARAHVKPKQQRGNGSGQERMIVLNRKKHLNSEQDYMLLFHPSFFTIIPDHF